MILIISNEYVNVNTKELCKLTGKPTICLSPSDFSSLGWQIDTSNFANSIIVARGKSIRIIEISFVINLVQNFSEIEFWRIAEPDRNYASAEALSLLYYILDGFECPVINKISLSKHSYTFFIFERFAFELLKYNIPIINTGQTISIPEYDEGLLVEIFYYKEKIYCRKEVTQIESIKLFCKSTGQHFVNLNFYPHENQKYILLGISFVPNLADNYQQKILFENDTTLGFV